MPEGQVALTKLLATMDFGRPLRCYALRGTRALWRPRGVDRADIPLGIRVSPANRHDSLNLAPILDAVPGVRHGRGRSRRRSNKLHADKAYDHRRCRAGCRARSIRPCIARRGVEKSERLGRHRWVVGRTLAWLSRFRRLANRYERRAEIHEAFVTLDCALICLNQIRRLC